MGDNYLDSITKEQEAINVQLEKEAIEFIKEHEPDNGYYLGFSGGKDSCVIKKLADMAGVKYTAYYSATGIDPPEIVKFIKQNHSDVIFLRPKKSFYELIEKMGYPSVYRRWCCDALKKDPGRKIKLKHRLMGIRADESIKRASRDRVDYNSRYKQYLYKPIFDWLEFEVWDFIDRHKIPYCKLYDEGFGRIGCVICPFICGNNRKRVDVHMKRWPGMYRAFERAMRKRWDSYQKNRNIENGYYGDFGEFMDMWYRRLSYPPKGE